MFCLPIRLLMDVWVVSTFGLFPPFWRNNNVTINFQVQLFVWTYVFILAGYITGSGIARSDGNSVYLQNFCTVSTVPKAVNGGSNSSAW